MSSSEDVGDYVGFFDSGVGGLTVLEAFRKKIPRLLFHYFADTAHCPYGDRPLEEVKRFALQAVDFLQNQGCKTVIMACNISSSVAMQPAHERFPELDIYGLVNKELAREVDDISTSGRVGVLATSGTVKSKSYLQILSSRGLDVIQQACSPLVPLIESGHLEGPLVRQTLQPLLNPLLEFNVDTIVLGCTHYPFLSPVIKDMTGNVEVVDPGKILADRLAENIDSCIGDSAGSYWASGETESLVHIFETVYNRSIPSLSTVEPGKISSL
ncbi:MAG: glutamate racemase [bacterium]